METKPWSSTAPPAEFRPYVDSEERIGEFSLRAVVLGALFGVLFRRRFCLRRPARGPHRFRFHSHRGAFDQHSARLRPLHDSRK